MDILSYLSTLIKTHKEVGIPGLGTIYKRKSPGRYDTETHSFLPPSYTLAFTSDLKEQELLTGLISKKKNISIDAATYFVEQFSENILDELSNQQESDFGDLGTFSTATGSITFLPKQEQNFGFDFYGLPPLKDEPASNAKAEIGTEEIQEAEPQIADRLPGVEETLGPEEEEPQISREQLELENNNADLSDGTETDESPDEFANQPADDDLLIAHLDSTEESQTNGQAKNDDQEVYEEIAELGSPVLEPEPLQVPAIETVENITEEEPAPPDATSSFTLDYTEEDKQGMPVYLKIIIALLAIAAIAGITYAVKPELFTGAAPEKNVPDQDVVQTIKQNDQHKIDSVAQADSIRKSNEKAILAADSAKDSVAAGKPLPKAAGNNIISYDIIAASLLNKKEADRFLADMKKRGIPATIAKMPGKRIKISIGSFADQETANKQLEILKKTTRIPGIYVTPIRHTNNLK